LSLAQVYKIENGNPGDSQRSRLPKICAAPERIVRYSTEDGTVTGMTDVEGGYAEVSIQKCPDGFGFSLEWQSQSRRQHCLVSLTGFALTSVGCGDPNVDSANTPLNSTIKQII
jgi:hypothetical protein